MIEWMDFKDLKFEKHFNLVDLEEQKDDFESNPTLKELYEQGKNDIQCRMFFGNGFGVSIIRGHYTYGGEEGLYELAIISDDGLQYNTAMTEDVLGYLTEKEIEQIVYSVQCLENYSPDKKSHDFINGDAKLYWKMTGNDQL